MGKKRHAKALIRREMFCRGHKLVLDGAPLVMGILNITPDSFSDGGYFLDPESALRQADRLVYEGADMIDIGAESTRPGYQEVTAEEEWARLEPVLRPLLQRCSVPVSVDTQKACIAEKAMAAGAHIINDIWGLQGDCDMAAVAARYEAPVVVMHNRRRKGTFDSVQGLLDEMLSFFEASVGVALHHGVPAERLIVDPGIGFGKNAEQNLNILRHLERLQVLGCPILLGVSHKSVIRDVLRLGGSSADSTKEGDALTYLTLPPTIALNVLGLAGGASIFRVHDVKEHKLALNMAYAVLAGKGDDV